MKNGPFSLRTCGARAARSLLVRDRRGTLAAVAFAFALSCAANAEPPVELSDVAAGNGGFVIIGIDLQDHSGNTVSGAGDVNGDGFDDVIIGAKDADPGGDSAAGESYVVFGNSVSTAPLTLSTIAGGGCCGFVINGIDASDLSGESVSGAGDVNGDGLDDLVIGASQGDPSGIPQAGETYVVFGKASFTAVNLATVAGGGAGAGGFVINGAGITNVSGRSVSGAGDVNGDGLADVIVGAQGASPNGMFSGTSYVVFGKASTSAVNLIGLGSGGFAINGIASGDLSGYSVSGAGDVNGDGLADVVIGALLAGSEGQCYVVFGKASTTSVSLATVAAGGAGAGGFVINGGPGNNTGSRVSDAGDVNGDGLGDVIVVSDQQDRSHVVFGKASTSAVNLSNIAAGGGGGFLIEAGGAGFNGNSVSAAGDMNSDGLADVIVGAANAPAGGDNAAGVSYVVFGKTDAAAVDPADIAAGDGGFIVNGIDPFDTSGTSVSAAGDFNGDGLADLLIGAENAEPGSPEAAGETYVVFNRGLSCGGPALPANLISGTDGTFTSGPNFSNATRGIDVTVLGASNQSVSAMTLKGFSITTPSATVSARIYHSSSASLIASGSTTVSNGSNQSVTIPVSTTTLIAGTNYRICFYVSASPGASGTMFDPGFPYMELSARFRINQANLMLADAFPTKFTVFVPQITVASKSVCPADFDATGDVGFGDLTILLLHWGPCPPHCPWDIDGSGDVGFGDLTTLLLGWG